MQLYCVINLVFDERIRTFESIAKKQELILIKRYHNEKLFIFRIGFTVG